MKFTLSNGYHSVEILNENGFVAEVAREDEGNILVSAANKVSSILVIEFHHSGAIEWGISLGGHNPTDESFFPMPKETAFRLQEHLQSTNQ